MTERMVRLAVALLTPAVAAAADAPNLYLYRACELADPTLCPGGVPDAAAFDAVYEDPSSAPPIYPAGGSGAYTRVILPKCEDGSSGATCPNGPGPTDPIRCSDGTRPLYYIRPSPTGSSKWWIRTGPGGKSCGEDDAINCYDEYVSDETDFSSAFSGYAERRNLQGVMSTAADNLFADWNKVWVDKCSADPHIGHRTRPGYRVDLASGDQVTLYFHGYRIRLAMLEHLRATTTIGGATQIVFGTMSNGSQSAYKSIDHLAGFVSSRVAPDAEVVLVASGGPAPDVEAAYADAFGTFPPDDAYPRARFRAGYPTSVSGSICGAGLSGCISGTCTYDAFMDDEGCFPYHEGRGLGGAWVFPRMRSDYPAGSVVPHGGDYEDHVLWGTEAGMSPLWEPLDRSCLYTHGVTYAESDLRACRDPAHVLTYHVSTPVFTTAQLGDPIIRAYGRGWAPFDHDGDGAWGTMHKGRVYSRPDYIGTARSTIAQLDTHGNGRTGFETGARGAFVDNTVDHAALRQNSLLHRTMRDGAGVSAELQLYLMTWLDGRRDTTFCVDAEDRTYFEDQVPLFSYVGAPFGPMSCKTDGCNLGTPLAYPCPYSDPSVTGYQMCQDPYANQADTVTHACVLP